MEQYFQLRIGGGFKHEDTKQFVMDLVSRGLIEEKGGVQKPGALFEIYTEEDGFIEDHNVGKMTLEDAKACISQYIKY